MQRPSRPNPGSGENGIALIAVLWISVLLAMIAAAAGNLSRTDVALAANMQDSLAAETAVESAMAVALFTYMTGDGSTWHGDGTPYGWTIDGIEVLVAITDERARVDLNAATENALAAMFERLGEGEAWAERMARQVVDYRDASLSATGLPSAANQPGASPGVAFGLVEEIRSAVDIDEALAMRVAELATVYTGMAAPIEARVRAAVIPTPEEMALGSTPTALAPLSDSPPGRSPVIRLRAEARSASGALSAKEWVLQIDSPPPNRPYATLMLRRVDQKWLLPGD